MSMRMTTDTSLTLCPHSPKMSALGAAHVPAEAGRRKLRRRGSGGRAAHSMRATAGPPPPAKPMWLRRAVLLVMGLSHAQLGAADCGAVCYRGSTCTEMFRGGASCADLESTLCPGTCTACCTPAPQESKYTHEAGTPPRRLSEAFTRGRRLSHCVPDRCGYCDECPSCHGGCSTCCAPLR